MAKAFPNTGVTIIDSSSDLPAASAALEGVLMFQKDSNELKICDGSSWVSVVDTDNKPMDAWTNYTPTLAQGATNNIAKTLTYCRYLRLGKLVIAQANITIGGSGTANSVFTMTLPVTAVLNNYYYEIGFAQYYVGVNNKYPLIVETNGSNNVARFQYTHRTDDTSFGASGNFVSAVASGQALSFFIVYEAA